MNTNRNKGSQCRVFICKQKYIRRSPLSYDIVKIDDNAPIVKEVIKAFLFVALRLLGGLFVFLCLIAASLGIWYLMDLIFNKPL